MLNVESIRKLVYPICKKYDIDRLFLFGSYARNEATENSDVDLRIDRGKLTGFAYGGFYGDIQRALGVQADILTTEQMKNTFKEAIQKDEVLIYERTQ